MSYLELARQALARRRDEQEAESAVRPAPVDGAALEPTAPVSGCDQGSAPRSGSPPTPEDVEAMALDKFAQAGLIVQVEVPRFGCDVLFVSDDVPEVEVEDRGLTVYRAAELRKLYRWQPKPHDLRVIHDVKTILGHTIMSIEKRGDPDEQGIHESAKGVRDHDGAGRETRAQVHPTRSGEAVG